MVFWFSSLVLWCFRGSLVLSWFSSSRLHLASLISGLATSRPFGFFSSSLVSFFGSSTLVRRLQFDDSGSSFIISGRRLWFWFVVHDRECHLWFAIASLVLSSLQLKVLVAHCSIDGSIELISPLVLLLETVSIARRLLLL
ncbi:hypothetical protein U1Q18_014180 [Sarracenia purpurea var. burkii]